MPGRAPLQLMPFMMPHVNSVSDQCIGNYIAITLRQITKDHRRVSWPTLIFYGYNRLKNCATSPDDEEDVECPTVNQTLHVMLDRINQVISSPDIDAIHDAPYPNFAEYILIASKKIRGNEPIVVLSERNPQEWAERRIQHQTNVACRGNDINIGTNLYQCLQSAIQAGLGSQRINTIFYQFNELAGSEAANVTTIIGKGFELYQNKMREVSAYHTNLFERNPRIDESQLAEEISYAIANTTLEESTASFRELSSSSPIRYAMDPKTVVHVRSGKYDLVLPSDRPDPKPQSLLDELLDHQLACPATSQVRISFDPQHGDKNVILKSYSIDGEPKTEGGDEYYITYTDKTTENDFVDAVAYSRDMGDGTYVLEQYYLIQMVDLALHLSMVVGCYQLSCNTPVVSVVLCPQQKQIGQMLDLHSVTTRLFCLSVTPLCLSSLVKVVGMMIQQEMVIREGRIWKLVNILVHH